MKKEIAEGLSGGCLNACCGSGCSQYSSSQSIGKSRSKLQNGSKHGTQRQRSTYSSSCIAHGRPNDELIWRSYKTSTLQDPSERMTPQKERAKLTKTPVSTIHLLQTVPHCTICAGEHPHLVPAESRSQQSSSTLAGPTSHARTAQTTRTVKPNKSQSKTNSTYTIGLQVLQAGWPEQRPSHHLHLLKILPSCRVFRRPPFDGIQENARIVRITRCSGTHQQIDRTKGWVT